MRVSKPTSLYVRNVLYALSALVFTVAFAIQYVQLAAQAAITSGAPASYSDISSGSDHTCGINAGLAYCWGSNATGQLGNNSTSQSLIPVAVDTSGVLSGKTVTSISAGGSHTCAVASGLAYCWGYNAYGRLGNNSTVLSLIPVAVNTSGVLSGKTVTSVSNGANHTCAVASSAAYCWGFNGNGRLGDGSNVNSSVPVAVSVRAFARIKGVDYPASALQGKTVTAVSSGVNHTCAVASGIAACWGYNLNGQLGNSTTTDSSVPVAVNTTGVLSGKTVIAIAAGGFHSCAVASSAAYCWGSNTYGQLGNNSTAQSLVPVAVNTSGALTVTAIAAGVSHSCAVASSIAACWGSNTNGRLGDNSSTQSLIPVAVNTSGVLSGKTVTVITAGNPHSCAIASGAAYCWGSNATGQLGNNSITQSLVPVLVKGIAPLVNAANRFFLSANSLQPGSPLSAVGTVAPVTTGEAFRLRTGITTNANSTLIPGDNSYSLQFAQKTGATCSVQTTGFAAVTTSSAIAWYTNSNALNGSAITFQTGDPTATGTTNYQTYISGGSSFINTQNISPSYNGIWDFSLKDNVGTVGINYCLKIVYSNGNNLEQYSSYPEVSIIPVELSLGFVNSSGTAIIGTPLVALNVTNSLVTCQTTNALFLPSEIQLRVGQTGTTSNGWNVSIAATNGPTALWTRNDNGAFYDYNDSSGSPAGCNSGSDGDGFAGQFALDLGGLSRTPGPGCSNSVSSGGNQVTGFTAAVSSITIAVSSAQTLGNCYWDLSGMSMYQTIPAYQPPGNYSLDFTATMVAQ